MITARWVSSYQARPKALYRTFLEPDRRLRHAMRWYSQMGRRVWFHELFGFPRDPLLRNGPTLRQFWGEPQDVEQESMLTTHPGRRPVPGPQERVRTSAGGA